ncbi:MAG TPA: tRNA (adenosine(37)-N6)-threonylcarbamoyltransferase complex ATPase subunit type 1 TsaE [Bacteroidales bacterium]|jgi:tRNA threonylcarbamoyladenosine biosynthesis protein TsaE|nr:tRNA threonylcarbamoyladenosine biosynthesis protein TsaE [Bacteroidales bacterium]MCZ2316153.1 tRNA (adenosine(37)-N6)-threonylcarbamoyltransferase complex ATPase subunit type 1 TsaE [Bacteroidales bacterium]NLZ08655.1 tRNA (adenosine(37)-N6)-threonylcarbamoyltransferase complex ATPase subunit type 1 TsaE [Bacteroidales bacterium]HNR27424.1 tRNA (adenosine(37)-N6)-threonylcarbamoyltransferase complex ATPase subunit type 1 TsaE [Bacteroidales bacterium]HNT48554.1 tRNA (adenosine(37)-N6)-thre
MELIFSLENIRQAAGALLQHTGKEGVVAFYGQMGAGKTTFIKALCQVLGTEDWVNSPSFALVNEYLSSEGIPIYHFDFFRIKNIQEALDMGCTEYFETPGTLSLVEWPELITPLLPPDTWHATLEVLPSGERKLTVSRG